MSGTTTVLRRGLLRCARDGRAAVRARCRRRRRLRGGAGWRRAGAAGAPVGAGLLGPRSGCFGLPGGPWWRVFGARRRCLAAERDEVVVARRERCRRDHADSPRTLARARSAHAGRSQFEPENELPRALVTWVNARPNPLGAHCGSRRDRAAIERLDDTTESSRPPPALRRRLRS